LKIGIVLTNPPQPSETFLNSLITVLSKEHEVILFLSEKSKKYTNLSQRTYFNKRNIIRNSFFYGIKFLFTLKKFKSLKKYTKIKQLLHDFPIWSEANLDYLHFAFGNLAFGRENYAEIMGCKMSISFRGSDINVYPQWHNLKYNDILEKCTKIHCNSQMLKLKILCHNNQIHSKIYVIPPGLQAEFNLNTMDIELLNQKRLKNNLTKIVSVGRLHWIKGFEQVFEALGKLKKEGVNFEYCIIGQGPEEEKLVFLSHFYGIQRNVKFLGLKKTAEIRRQFESANLYVQTSWAEGFSNSTMEAQAIGLPAIVTPISGMKELILHEETGYIAESHCSRDILLGFKWYFSLSEDAKMILAKKANQKVKDNFSMEQLSQNWMSFFN
jgi:colanic acid/amylovoran biosynthesis glycosyltransferase